MTTLKKTFQINPLCSPFNNELTFYAPNFKISPPSSLFNLMQGEGCMTFSLQNTWVTYHIFRLSELHQCDQEMLLNISISLCLVSEDLFGYIPGIVNHRHATKELSISGCARSNSHTKKCWFIGFLKGETNLYGFNKRGKLLN